MSYEDFPWFRDQVVKSILNVQEPSPGHFFWPDIDVDLTEEMIDEFHLNRLDKRMAKQVGVTADDVLREDRRHVWLRTDDIKEQMLSFFSHFYRPRIYLVDSNFMDGGLLLVHRNCTPANLYEMARAIPTTLNLQN